MVWTYGNQQPEQVERGKKLGQFQMTINFNAEEIEPTEEAGYIWRWQSVTLEPGFWTYDSIVSAVVTERYPADRMQAVVNNYLAEPEDPVIVAEFSDMQNWRRFAKDLAHNLIETVQV